MSDPLDFYLRPAFWRFSPAPQPGSRRPLFQDGDKLFFQRLSPMTARLTAHSADVNSLVLGRSLVLGLQGEALTCVDYGREIRFERSPAAADKLRYSANYQEGPVEQPDESGEGDPNL